jgi:ribonuclease HII
MYRMCSSRYERLARRQGWQRIAGVDEVGRGSLFGPVMAAAVILNPAKRIPGLDDSKKLCAARRAELSERIRERARAWAVGQVESGRIDAWNILQASRQAMEQAIGKLTVPPDYLLLDAISLQLPVEQMSLIHGDARSFSIAAASILAKVERDRVMDHWHIVYPQYHLGNNKGYGTPEHLEALRVYGPTPQHRYSYAPVRESTCWAVHASQQPLPLELVASEVTIFEVTAAAEGSGP